MEWMDDQFNAIQSYADNSRNGSSQYFLKLCLQLPGVHWNHSRYIITNQYRKIYKVFRINFLFVDRCFLAKTFSPWMHSGICLWWLLGCLIGPSFQHLPIGTPQIDKKIKIPRSAAHEPLLNHHSPSKHT